MQLFFPWNGNTCRLRREFPVAEAPARCLVNYHMQLCRTLRGRCVPSLRGGRDQHPARRSTAFSQSVEKASYGMRAVRVLISISLIANRLVDFHALPVGVELVRKH